MRVAQSRINLGIVAARRGDLDQAVSYGHSAFDYQRQSLTALASSSPLIVSGSSGSRRRSVLSG
jgi:hypothetical protein